MDVRDLLHKSMEWFATKVEPIAQGEWRQPTPCSDWDVRALVAHVVDEDRWVEPILDGRTIAEVLPTLPEDPIGDDPVGSWKTASAEAHAAIDRLTDVQTTVHLSFGDVPAELYMWQLFADHLIHGWDLATAIAQDVTLPAELVGPCLDWFAGNESIYRDAGVIGPRADNDVEKLAPQDQLLARFGRDSSPKSPLAVIARFNKRFGSLDAAGAVELMRVDGVWESTTPPAGQRISGRAELQKAWSELFGSSPRCEFEVEKGLISGQNGIYQWLYRFGDGPNDYVRGIDVFRITNGEIAEKLSYVKG